MDRCEDAVKNIKASQLLSQKFKFNNGRKHLNICINFRETRKLLNQKKLVTVRAELVKQLESKF